MPTFAEETHPVLGEPSEPAIESTTPDGSNEGVDFSRRRETAKGGRPPRVYAGIGSNVDGSLRVERPAEDEGKDE